MSFDFNLETVCNHRVFRELIQLNSDQKSLRLNRPLAASNVTVYASETMIPKSMYLLVNDPESITSTQNRMVQFKQKWRSPTDYFEITYVTIRQYCPKCIGFGTLNDLCYDVRGGLREVRDEKLLLQNVEKITVTEINSNPFQPFYGTGLVSMLGDKITDMDFLSTRVIGEINSALGKLKDMQSQYISTGRVMTNGEILQTVENIQVNPDPNNPMIIRADVTVTAKSGKTAKFSQFLKVVA